MMVSNIDLYLGDQAVEKLLRFCEERQMKHFMLVADRNTYTVLGHAVETALTHRGWDVKSVVFQEAEVVPDEAFIFQVLLNSDPVERTYLAVGTGTLTDITRFASHRNRRPFISLPTAPSVDGFTSPSASLVIQRMKVTVMAQTPQAVIADLPTVAASPQAMIAAGYGDVLGKAIALADWRLGHILWDEPYSDEVAVRVLKALDECVLATADIGQATTDGIRTLMYSLADTGLSMLAFGNSRPASGAEHYMSHYLELKLLREGRHAVLHGAKVGLCSIWMAELYEQLRGMTRLEMQKRLAAARLPDRAGEVERIHKMFGAIAPRLVVEQAPFLDLSAQDYENLKNRILIHWDKLQELAAEAPSGERMAELIREAGGATSPSELGLSDEEMAEALEYSHYIRNRFTICKLARILGLQRKG